MSLLICFVSLITRIDHADRTPEYFLLLVIVHGYSGKEAETEVDMDTDMDIGYGGYTGSSAYKRPRGLPRDLALQLSYQTHTERPYLKDHNRRHIFIATQFI